MIIQYAIYSNIMIDDMNKLSLSSDPFAYYITAMIHYAFRRRYSNRITTFTNKLQTPLLLLSWRIIKKNAQIFASRFAVFCFALRNANFKYINRGADRNIFVYLHRNRKLTGASPLTSLRMFFFSEEKLESVRYKTSSSFLFVKFRWRIFNTPPAVPGRPLSNIYLYV